MKNIYSNTVFSNIMRCLLLVALVGGNSVVTNAQNVSFTKRNVSRTINGDFQMIGNTNLTLVTYSNGTNNSNNDMKVVDSDDDNSTHNSSSATLNFSNENGATPAGTNILFAGLYWSARTDDKVSDTRKKQIKIKGPNGGYTTYTASDIRFPGEQNIYVGFVDVTSLVAAQKNGAYSVADMALTTGNGGSVGYYGGWGMIVVYENTKMNLRDISVFDGYAFIDGPSNANFTLDVAGIKTVKSGIVNMKMGLMAGEGDIGISGDYFKIKDQSNNWVSLSHDSNSTTNFFNSSVYPKGSRNPDLTNNTGVDVSMFTIPNENNSVIKNEQTSATFKYGSIQDTYVIYCITMSSDAYLPGIKMTKTCTPGCYTLAGDKLKYKFEVINNGNAPLNTVDLTDPKATPIYSSGDSNKNNILDLNETWVYTATYTVTPTDLTNATLLNTATVKAKDPQSKKVTASSSNTVYKTPVANAGSDLTKTCSTNSNGGTIGVAPVSGVTYLWTPATDLTNATVANPTANPSVTTTYTVTATNTASGCTSRDSVTVIVDKTAPIANAGQDATINCNKTNTTLTATGGLSYSWSPSLGLSATNIANPTANPIATTTYTVTVTAANGCTASDKVLVTVDKTAPSAPAVTLIQPTCGVATGTITVTAPKGTGMKYSIDGLTYTNTTGIFTLVASETYNVTAKSAGGCISLATCVKIDAQPTTPTVAIRSVVNVSCKGNATGSATASATGGTAAYSYSWNTVPVQNTETATGLLAGTYIVTVTDAKGCTDTESVTIMQPAAVLTATIGSVVNVSCKGNASGSATASATGGTAAYSYNWNTVPVQNTATATGLLAGTYIVTVTDDKGCTDTESVTIKQPAAVLTAAIGSVVNVSCRGNTSGSATASATGGTAAYSYSWNTVPVQNTATATGLLAGTFIVTVTDAKGCTDTESVTIKQPAAVLTCSVVQNKAISANGFSDGKATVTPLGGNAGYTYLWDNGETTAKAVGLDAGSHFVTVTDSKGCKTTCEIIITQPDVFSCSISLDAPVKCFGDRNGIATVTALGGNGEYAYLWDNGETTAQAVGLTAGSHTVTVIDKLGYTTTCNVNIVQPQAALSALAVITNNHNCVGCSSGSIDLTVSGGTAPYTFLWSNGAITEDISNLPKGTYSVEITDDKDCKVNYSFTITESNINITKDGTYVDSNQDGITNIGDVVSYNFVLTNTGNVALADVTVTDNNAVVSGGPIATLAVGASNSTAFTAVHAITQADINTGYVYNLSTAIGTPPSGPNVTDTSSDPTPCTSCPVNPECLDCTITPLTQTPGLEVIKTANTAYYSSVGDIINYTIQVKNTGNVLLHQIVVKDPLTGLDIMIPSLLPGISQEFTQNYTVTQIDRVNGSVTNVATANGLTPNETPITDSDDAVVEAAIVLGCGTITVHNAFSPNGDGINELFIIDNIDDLLCYPDNTVEIYNRWGVLVFETTKYNNQTNAFDGYSRGRATINQSEGLPTGTYYYILNYESFDGTGNIQINKKDGFLYLSK